MDNPSLAGADHSSLVVRAAHAVHRQLLWLLIASYVVAAFVPGPGLWLRGVSLGRVELFGQRFPLAMPGLMLALMLFNAGLGVSLSHLRDIFRQPRVLLAGLAANLVVPLAFLLAAAWLLGRFWHEIGEVEAILVGLALVVSMPVAGSSTAWSQNADGDLVTSLGLVLGSTLLSPLTTPWVLNSASLLATSEYADRLRDLSGGGTDLFLVTCVLLPSLLGMLTRLLVGEARVKGWLPTVKLINALDLLLLCYSNAAVSLPEAVAHPDPDFVVVMVVFAVGLCAVGFGAGWLVARFVRANEGQRNALVFGLGMNNNGTGLVLAASALAAYPRVMQPIIVYNLIQHLVAGAVTWLLFREVGTKEPRTK